MISYGEGVALTCSFIWATNGLILKTLSERVPPTLITAIRCGIATPIFWILLPFGPPLQTLLAVPLYEWAMLIGSVFIGILIGDLFYLHAMRHIGISRTMALVGTFPITTLLWEQLLLDLPITYTFALGSFFAATGTIIMSKPSKKENAEYTHMKRGVILALSAALLWGLSTTMLKPPLQISRPYKPTVSECPLLHSGYCSSGVSIAVAMQPCNSINKQPSSSVSPA